LYVTLLYVLCFCPVVIYLFSICVFLQAARRSTALILATLTCSSVFLDAKKNPTTDVPELIKYIATLGVTKADLPCKLKVHVEAALGGGDLSEQKEKKKDKKEKKEKKEKKAADEPKAKKYKKGSSSK
jgi:hypothetical protein